MPASNIETIYQIEEALETGIKSILDNSASLTTYRQRSTSTVATPFADIQISGTSCVGKQYKTSANGFNWPIDFNATLSVTVTTNRQENDASHYAYLGKVRRYLYDLTEWNSSRFPYLQIVSVGEVGSSPSIVPDERFDATDISFRIMFVIRDTAWP